MLFRIINNDSVVSNLFRAAGYTYGPLLGLYAFGLSSKRKVRDRWVPFICLIMPVLTYILNENAQTLFNGYVFGFEIIILNGLLTYIALLSISTRSTINKSSSIS